MQVKLKDIAEHLNLSISTVSKVINSKGRVSEETRERILNAVKEYNYLPNEIARSLKRKSANTIGIIVPDISNSFYATVIKGVEKIARENDHTVIVCNSDENIVMEEECVQLLLQKQITGLVIATVGGKSELFIQYKKLGIPVVFFDNLPQVDDNFDVVTIDNVKASYELTEHLVKQGIKNYAVITGPLNQSSAAERLQGFLKCLEHNGIPIDEKKIGVGEFKLNSGYEIMSKWLDDIKPRLALLAANNFLAYGAIKAIKEKGANIPEDIAVVCFDAVDNSGLIKPQITSVIQPAYEIGTIAADIIIRKENSEKLKKYERIILEPKLIINESSALK